MEHPTHERLTLEQAKQSSQAVVMHTRRESMAAMQTEHRVLKEEIKRCKAARIAFEEKIAFHKKELKRFKLGVIRHNNTVTDNKIRCRLLTEQFNEATTVCVNEPDDVRELLGLVEVDDEYTIDMPLCNKRKATAVEKPNKHARTAKKARVQVDLTQDAQPDRDDAEVSEYFAMNADADQWDEPPVEDAEESEYVPTAEDYTESPPYTPVMRQDDPELNTPPYSPIVIELE